MKKQNMVQMVIGLGVVGALAYVFMRNTGSAAIKAGDKIVAIDTVDAYKAAGGDRHGVFHKGNYIGTVQGYNSNGNWLIVKESGLWIPKVMFTKIKKQ